MPAWPPRSGRPATRSGSANFAVVCVDGGDTYWHRRANGDDPAGMIMHEVLPRAAAAGLRTGRVGVTGSRWVATAPCCWASSSATQWLRWRRSLRPIFGSYADARAANPGAFDGARTSPVTTSSPGWPHWAGCQRGWPVAPTTHSSRRWGGSGRNWRRRPVIGCRAGCWQAVMTTRSGSGTCPARFSSSARTFIADVGVLSVAIATPNPPMLRCWLWFTARKPKRDAGQRPSPSVFGHQRSLGERRLANRS